MTQTPDSERKTLILTGASRGIGHATVKRFSTAGWRVISCSRHPFPEDCPWDAGPEDHIQVDLANIADRLPWRAIDEDKVGALARLDRAAIAEQSERERAVRGAREQCRCLRG